MAGYATQFSLLSNISSPLVSRTFLKMFQLGFLAIGDIYEVPLFLGGKCFMFIISSKRKKLSHVSHKEAQQHHLQAQVWNEYCHSEGRDWFASLALQDVYFHIPTIPSHPTTPPYPQKASLVHNESGPLSKWRCLNGTASFSYAGREGECRSCVSNACLEFIWAALYSPSTKLCLPQDWF